jgi:hypothetical protein
MSEEATSSNESGGRIGTQSVLFSSDQSGDDRALAWNWGSPNVGAGKPDLYWPVVKEYYSNSAELPYEVPTKGSRGLCKAKHKTYYWLENPFESYRCPDCEYGTWELEQVDVHHIDEDWRNGAHDNLVGLCRRCHINRHTDNSTPATLYLGEWKEKFLSLGEDR